ncbi:MAG: PAS domain-containing methyl-accepting chemotaxis protein [Pseudomonadota bacterium]
MKINLPVTGVAREVDPKRPIVSETDTKGAITYANDAFVELSGFTREELMGKNHNIVRHPDMPPEAFADLWDTIKAGLPWRGIVKNRSKNGDHYWVEAYATPIYKGGQIVGYKSVRSRPNPAEVAACEALYKAIREKRAVLPSSRPGFLKRISLKFRVNLAIWSLALLFPIDLVLDQFGLGKAAYGLAALGFIIAIVMGWSLHRSISKPLSHVMEGLRQIAEGNLNYNLSSDRTDEFGTLTRSIESMRIHFRAMIADVILASQHTAKDAKALSKQMENLIANFDSQADRVSGTGAAMEEMSAAIGEVSSHTDLEAEVVAKTRAIVEQGNAKMLQSLEATKRVESAVTTSGETIHQLNDAIQKIGEITLTIKEIAEQTNLLALNAAIEAARAGEQGRGFAVVADEVRKLAERTTNSTVDISKMVENIRSTTNAAVSSMENAVTEVKQGMEHINASGKSLQQILDAANQVDEMTRSTSHTLKEQTKATEEVTHSMEQISQMGESNHRSLAEVGNQVNNLMHTAEELSLLVQHFEKSING